MNKNILYSRLKIFKYPEKIKTLSDDTSDIKAPLQVRVKPINACNHKCSYCAYHYNDELQLGSDMDYKDMIPKEKMLEIIDNFEEVGVKSVTFSGGGEPLLYPHIEETLEKLGKANIKFAAITNGTELNNNIATLFAKYGSWIRVSIDGWDTQSYSDYRKIKRDDFSLVLKNLTEFKKLKSKCKTGVVIIIDKKNASHIYELTKKLFDTGVDSVKMSPCVVSNDSTKNNEYHKTFFETAKKQISQSIGEFKSDNFEIFDTYHLLEDKFDKTYNWCPYLQVCPVIGADSNVYSCHDKAYNEDGLLFSIKEQSFKKAWFSNKNNFFKIDPSKKCNHHCVVNDANKMLIEFLSINNEHLEFV